MTNVRGSVERRSVVPDGDVVVAPFVSYLEVVVLRDVAIQVVKHRCRLFGVQLDDALCEPRTHSKP